MQERVNKFKPISKKEVTQMINQTQNTIITNDSKLYSSSQNKLFIRKPVVKRHGFVSPNIAKRIVIQNEQTKSPYLQSKYKKPLQSERLSEQDYWQHKEISILNNKLSIKRHISNKQEKNLESSNIYNNKAIKQAYFGNDVYALTQAGQNYKIQGLESSDNSQKDLCFLQNNKRKSSKQNMVINNLNLNNTKKVTRTQYFQNQNNHNDQVRSTTSRSMKQKEINFTQLRHQANNNGQAYVSNLQQNIRKLQKQNYTVNKKNKWLHQQIQMHLQKEHLMQAQKKGLQVQIKSKQMQIHQLIKQKQDLKKHLTQIKIDLERKEAMVRSKSIKDIETISSLKNFCNKLQDNSVIRQNRENQIFKGYYGGQSSSTERNKKLSFKTYPGVSTPKRRKQQCSKCSSISGNNQSFQELGQYSVVLQKSQVDKSQTKIQIQNNSILGQELQRLQKVLQQTKRQKDQIQNLLEESRSEIYQLKTQYLSKISKNNEEFQAKLSDKSKQIANLNQDLTKQQQQNKSFKELIQSIEAAHKHEVQQLNLTITELQNKIFTNYSQKPIQIQSIANEYKDLESQNPLQYFLDQSTIESPGQTSQIQHLQQQNKSLRIYIQKILQHYKYIKIQNRMLLKVKQQMQKIEKQKKQIKDQRDTFKKKLLDIVKNKTANNKALKNKGRLMDFDSQSSQQQSAVFQLSQSQILHTESDIKPN